MTSQCQQIKKEYQAIKALKTEFVLEYNKALQTGDLTKAKALKAELEEKRNELKEKVFIKEIKAIWENPQTLESKEIVINIDEQIERSAKLYKETLGIKIDKTAFKKIWLKNRKKIREQIETYGYDTVLLIPKKLPDLETLNEKLIETMEEPERGMVEKTNYHEGGGFKGVKNTEQPKNQIVLTKNVQDCWRSHDPIISATLGKDIMQLTGLSEIEVNKRISSQEPLLMDFTQEITDKNGNKKEISIKAGSLSLQEYIIFQRQYFEQYGKHLDDEGGQTWLLKSLSGVEFTVSTWANGFREFMIFNHGPKIIMISAAVRPTCSFSL